MGRKMGNRWLAEKIVEELKKGTNILRTLAYRYSSDSEKKKIDKIIEEYYGENISLRNQEQEG